jgi:hypothetical protein
MISAILVAGGAWAGPSSGKGGIPARVKELEVRLVALQGAVTDLVSLNARQQRIINRLRSRLEAAEDALEDARSILRLSRFVSVNNDPIDGLAGPHVIFEGVNVHIRSGSGFTNDDGELSGLGNLVVGYNEARSSVLNDRTGSHNIVLGDLQNFSSFGGLVAGMQNTISGEYATVVAGYSNTASGYAAHVSGGWANKASFPYCNVSGGTLNEASGYYSSVSGGRQNTASGNCSSVSGGYDRSAPGEYEWCASSLRALDPDGDITIESDSDITLTSLGGELNLSGVFLNLESTGNTDISAGAMMSISSVSGMNLTGSRIGLNAGVGGKPAARLGDDVVDPLVRTGIGPYIVLLPSGFGTITSGSGTVLVGD